MFAGLLHGHLLENSPCKISSKLVDNWSRNQRKACTTGILSSVLIFCNYCWFQTHRFYESSELCNVELVGRGSETQVDDICWIIHRNVLSLLPNKQIFHSEHILTIYPLCSLIEIFTHLKLCLATATHNFKWVKIINICLIWDKTFANLDVYTHFCF